MNLPDGSAMSAEGQDAASDGPSADSTVADGASSDDTTTDASTAEGTLEGGANPDGSTDAGAADAAMDTGMADGATDGASGSPCRAGAYSGPFGGTLTSHLTGVGIPVPVTGTVNLTLAAEGAAGTTCMVGGQSKDCGEVFALQSGTVRDTADGTSTDGGAVGGFPYFCTMTGALDCSARQLVDGWIQCTYCVGPLADGGGACALAGVGGHLAGTATASYDVDAGAFVMGEWNASEALAGNDGGTPGPDGGPPSAYLSDSGTYQGAGEFGGSGPWSATHP
jgi:hypothetical protein